MKINKWNEMKIIKYINENHGAADKATVELLVKLPTYVTAHCHCRKLF